MLEGKIGKGPFFRVQSNELTVWSGIKNQDQIKYEIKEPVSKVLHIGIFAQFSPWQKSICIKWVFLLNCSY